MKAILIFIITFMFLGTPALPQSLQLMVPTLFQSETLYYRNKRDAYIPEYSTGADNFGTNTQGKKEWWQYGFALRGNVDLIRWGKFSLWSKNRWYMDATNQQVRKVGWQSELGLPLSEKLEFSYFHHSRHCLECRPDLNYPVDNAYVVRYTFFKEEQ